MINKMARAITTNLLLSAKSTSARIMAGFLSPEHSYWLLGKHVVQDESVGHHLLSWLESRLDLLEIRVGLQEVSADDIQAAKPVAGGWHVDVIAIVHVQHGRCRDNGVHLLGLTAEGGPHEHAQAHVSRILHFDPDLARADAGIEDGA